MTSKSQEQLHDAIGEYAAACRGQSLMSSPQARAEIVKLVLRIEATAEKRGFRRAGREGAKQP